MLAALLLVALQAASIPDVGYEDAFPGLKFERIVGIAAPPDGTKRLYFIEQFQGKVLLLADGVGSKEAKVVLDIEPKVRRRGNEEGLLGFAFHPKFKENRKVYLQYSTSNLPKDPKNVEGRRNVLSEFTADAAGTSIDPKSEKILLEIPQPFENHNGGVIQFGHDGYLYLGLGDGGAANDPHGNGQNRMSLLGKFLRIDVDKPSGGLAYGIPKDNPFVGNAAYRPEIWSLGWRNPWGFHFDRKTGELWSGDVGQELWEEICVVVKGGNYGWNVRESFHEFKATKPPVQGKAPPDAGPFTDPVVEHDHVAAKSITGGCVYRGKAQPKLDGVYFYGDFVTGNMWGLKWDGKKMTANKLLFTHPGKQIAIFGEDADGEVLWSSFDGKVYRFTAK
jgi:quinoprotein glucose dehydrogenase